ncbi:hypothetical protein ACVWXN_010898 [Bradyrhizobium sp. i1.4.4]|uniref:hypothetical protein n=1 Tax=unclassified Bradyrhizobium TaxID=2631580 RepID=UPI003394C2D6
MPRPSRSEDDLELAAFDDLSVEIGQTITQSALSVLEKHPANHVSRERDVSGTEIRGAYGLCGHVGLNDAQDELRMAMGEVMRNVREVASQQLPS